MADQLNHTKRGDMETSTNTILGAINTAGIIGILVVLFVLFYRGDLMSRKVYEELTKHILKELCDQISDQIDKVILKLNGKATGKETSQRLPSKPGSL